MKTRGTHRRQVTLTRNHSRGVVKMIVHYISLSRWLNTFRRFRTGQRAIIVPSSRATAVFPTKINCLRIEYDREPLSLISKNFEFFSATAEYRGRCPGIRRFDVRNLKRLLHDVETRVSNAITITMDIILKSILHFGVTRHATRVRVPGRGLERPTR